MSKKDEDPVICFNGHDNLVTAVRVIELAKELGLKVEEKQGGINWIAFSKNGEQIENIAFYHPSHAYAFLLGVKAGRNT